MRPVVRRLRRALFLMPYVARHPDGVPLAHLAELLGITTRQMAEEVRDLVQVGMPDGSPGDFFDIDIHGRGPTARVVATPSRFLRRPPRLTPPEAHALLLGARALGGTRLEVFQEALDRATAKVRRALASSPGGPPAHVLLELGGGGRHDIFSQLHCAARDRHLVELDYASLSGRGRRKILVEPYGLLNHTGGWYVLGKSRTHAEGRLFVFKVERIASVTVLEESFHRPADFDLRSYQGDRMFLAGMARVTVKLRLRGTAARVLAGTFKHARREPDGAVVVKFLDYPTAWLATWVLRQGPDVEVVSPPDLAAQVAALARRVAEAHASTTADARPPSLTGQQPHVL